MTEKMLVKYCILVWIFAVFIESNAVTMGNGRKRVFKFRQFTTLMQTVSNSDKFRLGKPPISTKSTSAITCAALLMQYGPFTCMEYYDLQSTCRSFQGETVNSLNSKLNSGWSFYNGEHLGNPNEECKRDNIGAEYRGTRSITALGIPCMVWSANTPNSPSQNIVRDLKSQEGPEIANTNYCRNPDRSVGGPWCYTMDPNIRRKFCGIPYCQCYN